MALDEVVMPTILIVIMVMVRLWQVTVPIIVRSKRTHVE